VSILVNKDTKVIVQGITGGYGGNHARWCMQYGTKIVAGVTPGKGGQKFDDKVPTSTPCSRLWTRRVLMLR